MTSRLALLHTRLARLRRVRATVVLLSALAGAAGAVLMALFTVFLLDWLFALDIYRRLVVMALAGAGLGYFVVKYLAELVERRGDEVHAALWVERQHQIDSDLVAAIQFEREAAGELTSRRLSAAVVEYVAEAAPAIDVFRGFSSGPLVKRMVVCGICVAIAAGLVVLVPNHVRAFGQRLLLRAQAYPTRTQIAQVMVGQTVVHERGGEGGSLLEASAAEGQPLRFTVITTGARPSSVTAEVQPEDGSERGTRLVLKPVIAEGGKPGTFSGELPRVHEDVRYWISAGDARMGAGTVRMIALPIVEVDVTATPPAYAAASLTASEGTDGKSVLEGSTVDLVVLCTNGKALESVSLSVQTSTGSKQIALVAADQRRLRWTLPAGESALKSIVGDVRYEVQARDVDGLGPLLPVRGVIRVHPDAPPMAAGNVVHRLVVPSAQPMVGYRVADDHGIARLQLVVDFERVAHTTDAEEALPARPQPSATERIEISLPSKVVEGEQLPLAGSYALALSPFGLAKGDRIKLTLEAMDYRGKSAAGVTAASDSLILEVADESEVLAAIRQADERSEAQLNEIIRRQLGVGQEP